MKKEELLKKIKNEIDYCEKTPIKVNPAFASNQLSVIDLIEKYTISKYRDGDFDSFGNPRPFYDIVTFPIYVAAKMVEADVKDIKVMSEDDDYWTSFILEKELHFWLKEKYFGRFLNEMSYNWPKYGHIVAKKVDDNIELVPLRNLRFRPDVISMSSVPIVERHLYQPDEFLLEARNRNWENVNLVNLEPAEVTDNSIALNNPKLQIFEAWFPPNFLKSDYNYFIVSGDGIILAYSNMPKSPYKDLAWEKVFGRTMGRGQVEKLFHEQIYMNRIATEKSEGLMWTSKHLFQCRDNSMARNLLSQAENGEVFITNSPIEPVQNEERNLQFYGYDENKWETNAFRKTFTQELQVANSSVANAKAQIVSAQLQSGYFKQKKEELASFTKELIWDWVIPQFKNAKRKEHKMIMRNLLSGDGGSEKLMNMIVSRRTEEKKLNSLLNGKMIMPDEEKVMRAMVAETIKNEAMVIPENTYNDLEFKINIEIGNESLDSNSMIQFVQIALNTINNNPAILENGRTRTLFYKLLEMGGINPHELGDDPITSLSDQLNQLRQGGSISRPTTQQTPQPMVTNQTL
jgi:hypothetical protein